MIQSHRSTLGAALLLATGVLSAQSAPRAISVQLPASMLATSGRVLIYAEPADAALRHAKDGKVSEVDASPFSAPSASVAAVEVEHLAPGQRVFIDTDLMAYPKPFSQLPDGDYYVQAVLDVLRDDNYGGRGADDLLSTPVKLHLSGGSTPSPLVLDTQGPAPRDPWAGGAKDSAEDKAALAQARADARDIDFTSPRLSAFWGRPVHMRGYAVLPPDYGNGAQRYPVVYETHGFGGSLAGQARMAQWLSGAMRSGALPPMIWVVLDESSPTGTHEFADSVNNGPWGAALTEELIPSLESAYRMDAKPGGRFLNGHSSGGWATLWLQVRYPKVFGGTWPTSPDPSDFHDFTGVDLYAPGANVYHRADGSAYPLVRDHDKVIASYEQFAKLEDVIGPVGGQMASFDWVFSPKGVDGRPQPMFDRATGAVDPKVVAYWRDHYDIAHLVQAQWPRMKADLDGKIHLTVGTADTFYLDGAAHRLKAVLDGLGAKSEFNFLPGKTHMDLYVEGDDRRALLKKIAWQMYAVARPASTLTRVPPNVKPAAISH